MREEEGFVSRDGVHLSGLCWVAIAMAHSPRPKNYMFPTLVVMVIRTDLSVFGVYVCRCCLLCMNCSGTCIKTTCPTFARSTLLK